MNVRKASVMDMPDIEKMYQGYSGETLEPLGFKYDRAEVKIAVGGLIESGAVFVFEKDGEIRGAIAGLYMPSMFSKDKFYSIMFFYVVPEYRLGAQYFLNKIEGLLAVEGATKVAVAVLNQDGWERIEKLYEMSGFDLLERHYCKAIIQKEVVNAG